MFGAAGQALLRRATVGVVGVGGGGSIVVEQLAHLGVGRIVAVDFDTVEPHNLSRIVGARGADAGRSRKKVEVMRRLVRSVDPGIAVEAIAGDIADASVAARLARCDFLFLCTDTIASRLVANAIVHSHHVPMVQVGAKVDMRGDGTMETVYVAVRPVFPKRGCLACASLLDPVALQREAATDEERRAHGDHAQRRWRLRRDDGLPHDAHRPGRRAAAQAPPLRRLYGAVAGAAATAQAGLPLVRGGPSIAGRPGRRGRAPRAPGVAAQLAGSPRILRLEAKSAHL